MLAPWHAEIRPSRAHSLFHLSLFTAPLTALNRPPLSSLARLCVDFERITEKALGSPTGTQQLMELKVSKATHAQSAMTPLCHRIENNHIDRFRPKAQMPLPHDCCWVGV